MHTTINTIIIIIPNKKSLSKSAIVVSIILYIGIAIVVLPHHIGNNIIIGSS